jgi:DNA helicase IV
MNYTLDAEDFYAVIPGDNIQEKAYKRKQIELDGRLEQMEQYALKTKALKDVMQNAMIKRKPTDAEWMRYGDVSADVLEANKNFPDAFVTL